MPLIYKGGDWMPFTKNYSIAQPYRLNWTRSAWPIGRDLQSTHAAIASMLSTNAEAQASSLGTPFAIEPATYIKRATDAIRTNGMKVNPDYSPELIKSSPRCA